MPLDPTTHKAINAFDDFSFLMLDGKKFVRVDVHRRLLEDIAESLHRSPAGYLAALEGLRRSIEQIASAKYDEGDYLKYANSCIVSIKKADWMRHISH
jgi:hypothetical protein